MYSWRAEGRRPSCLKPWAPTIGRIQSIFPLPFEYSLRLCCASASATDPVQRLKVLSAREYRLESSNATVMRPWPGWDEGLTLLSMVRWAGATTLKNVGMLFGIASVSRKLNMPGMLGA